MLVEYFRSPQVRRVVAVDGTGCRCSDQELNDIAGGAPSPWYHDTHVRTELEALGTVMFRRGGVLHYLDAHNSYHLGRYVRGHTDFRFSATVHQPASVIEAMYGWHDPFAQLDGAVVVSRAQLKFVRARVHGPVEFIPIGIDANHFRPAATVDGHDRPFVVLFVGHWLRDLFFANRLIERLVRDPEIIVAVVVAPWWRNAFAGHPRLRLYSEIDERYLRRLYHRAGCAVMPLLDATANTTLLETGCSGTPLVISDVGGVRDYVDESCAVLLDRNDVDLFCDAIYALKADPDRRRRLGLAAHQHLAALADWPVVAAAYDRFFQRLLEGAA